MLIGYARVSSTEQILDLQLDALNAAECKSENIYTDKKSGKNLERKGLNDALSHLREEDTLMVWRLDRLGRTLKELIEIVNDLNKRGVQFRSLQEGFDTTTPGGELFFHVFGAVAQFERKIIIERTQAGLQAARARGRLGGRPKIADLDPKKIEMAKKLYKDMDMPVQEILDTLHMSKSTFYRYVGRGENK